MSKAVLISIRPEWVKKILTGEKTLEVRKTRPTLETPFKVYIYCTKPKHKFEDYFVIEWGDFDFPEKDFFGGGFVIGEFVCDTYVTDKTFGHDALFNAAACMSESDAVAYSAGTPFYGWYISDLKIYDTPKELNAFKGLRKTKFGYAPIEIKRPPQSWCYVEEQ